MPKIRQSDITNGSITISRLSTLTFITTSTEFDGNISASVSLGTSTAMAASDPLFIKENGIASNGWAQEQDWTVYAASLTTVAPISVVSSGAVIAGTATSTLTNGDVVGIYGPGAWSAGPNLTIGKRDAAGAGSQNSAIIAGGNTASSATDLSELFNGSAWLSGPVITIAKESASSAGSQNAALIAGGFTNSAATNLSELFNGVTWTAGATLSGIRMAAAGAGSSSAALVAGGYTNAATNTTELFNGSTWSTSGNLSLARYGLAGCGSQNSALVTGGYTEVATGTARLSELFNGSTWAASALLGTAKYAPAGIGHVNAALMAGGLTDADLSNTSEIFNGSAWSAGALLSVAKRSSAGAGSAASSLIAGGTTGTAVRISELHIQSKYAKLNFENIKAAKNIGIITAISGAASNIKLLGYVPNMTVTSANSAITTAAQWANTYMVLSASSPNVSSTNNPQTLVVKSSVEADDFVIGKNISQTQTYVYGNSLFPLFNIIRW